jgi:hypothetical protein
LQLRALLAIKSTALLSQDNLAQIVLREVWLSDAIGALSFDQQTHFHYTCASKKVNSKVLYLSSDRAFVEDMSDRTLKRTLNGRG